MSEDFDRKTEGEKNNSTAAIIRKVTDDDLEWIKVILNQWIRDFNGEIIQEEVDEVLDKVAQSIVNGTENYILADCDGRPVGIMGFDTPSEVMAGFAATENPAEITNAYVSAEMRQKGVGRLLVKQLEELVKSKGFTEIIVNSGPRYRETGWPFYDSLEGFERVGTAENYYGEGAHAPVWHKALN